MCKRILIVDDDSNASRLLKVLLESEGHRVREENDSARAIQHAREFQPDFVLLDYFMPVVDGGDVAWQIATDASLKKTKLIVCSGAPLTEITLHMPPGGYRVLEKPVNIDALREFLKDA